MIALVGGARATVRRPNAESPAHSLNRFWGHIMINAERLCQLFQYEPDSGIFKRLFACGQGPIGSTPGRKNSRDGRLQIKIAGKMYYGHRLAWLYMTGEWPQHEIDHINGDVDDNRWENLRDVTKALNLQNQRSGHVGSASRALGVYYNKKNRKWIAQITTNGKQIYLGSFAEETNAKAAYLKAKREQHPTGEIAK